jgi:hypothetical protein
MMPRSLPFRVLPLMLLGLAGCAENWTRPGTSTAQADAEYAACQQAARQELPPRMERRERTAARPVYERTCTRDGGRETCRQVYVRTQPATYENVDVNDSARSDWARACMRQRGYTRDGLRWGG